jgi:phosphopantetheinyl transferase (holo-ACP synthase)
MPDDRRPDLPVYSSLERVPIQEVEADWERIGHESFTEEEKTALDSKRAQTRAGFLAVKKALVALYSDRRERGPFREKEFVLSHNEKGAPELVRSQVADGSTPFISISHTREQAYGIAVLQEAEGV